MPTPIDRDYIIDQLPGNVRHDRFLFYLMGPYQSFNLNRVLSEDELESIDIDDLPGPIHRLFKNRDEIDDALAMLRRVQGELRSDQPRYQQSDRAGVNAYLAVDVDIDVEDVDAVTQSIEFSRCSNVSAFIFPHLGLNLGVGEEAGAVLEALADTHSGRLVFMRDADVTTEMIRSAKRRWDFRLLEYEDEEDLVMKLRKIATEVMDYEAEGRLDCLD